MEDGRLPLQDEPTSERIKRQVGETDEDQVGTGRTGRSRLFGTWASILYTKRKKDEKVIRLVGWNTCEAAELYRGAHTHTHTEMERERETLRMKC